LHHKNPLKNWLKIKNYDFEILTFINLNFNISASKIYLHNILIDNTKFLPKFTQSLTKALPKPSPVGFNRFFVNILQRPLPEHPAGNAAEGSFINN
jgi:hypothetical protein